MSVANAFEAPLSQRCLPLPARSLAAGLLLLALSGAAPGPARAADPGSARGLIEHQHWKRAREIVEADLKARPDDPAVLCAAAEVRAEFGDLEGAQALAERAVKLAPGDAQAHESLGNVAGERAGRAGVLKALGLAKLFRKEAETAIALDPGRIESRRNLIEFHLRAPGMAGGDKKKAKVYADEVARLDPAEGALALMGIAQHEKDSVTAAAQLKRAVELDPKSFRARMTMAGWCAAPWRARWAEAEEHARAARDLAPDRSSPYALLAQLYAHQDRWADLEATLAQAAASCPDDRGAWYQAGRVLLVDGKELPRAEKCFRHYLEMEPEPGTPSLAHARWRLGLVLEKEGRKSDAVAEMEAALKLKPDLQEAKKDLRRLKG